MLKELVSSVNRRNYVIVIADFPPQGISYINTDQRY